MQIDSQHFPELANYGIKPEQLLSDSCLNIYTGVHYLAIAFKKWGVNWQAVGAYNAGFKKSDLQNERRLNYAKSIEQYYKAFKNSKTMHQRKWQNRDKIPPFITGRLLNGLTVVLPSC